jgi:hypothetical protein
VCKSLKKHYKRYVNPTEPNQFFLISKKCSKMLNNEDRKKNIFGVIGWVDKYLFYILHNTVNNKGNGEIIHVQAVAAFKEISSLIALKYGKIKNKSTLHES